MYEKRNQCDGAIYTNNYKESEKQPDWTGKVAMTREFLKELVTRLKAGDVDDNGNLEVRVALWNRTSKNKNEYKYCRLDSPQKQEQKPEPVQNVDDNLDTFNDEDIPF